MTHSTLLYLTPDMVFKLQNLGGGDRPPRRLLPTPMLLIRLSSAKLAIIYARKAQTLSNIRASLTLTSTVSRFFFENGQQYN